MLFLEIAFWIIFGFSLVFIAIQSMSSYIPKNVLAWIGGIPINIIFLREFFVVQISLVSLGLPILLLIPLGIISFLVSSYFLWYIIRKLISNKILVLVGKIIAVILIIYLYSRVIEIRYPTLQWADAFSSLAIYLSLQSTFGRWLTQAIIPISIPIAIALWGWLNQRRQFEISKRSEDEKLFRSYIDDMFSFLNEVHEMESGVQSYSQQEWRFAFARTKTQSILKSLSNYDYRNEYKTGKRRIVELLYVTKLLSANKNFHILKDTDMSHSDLSGLDLKGADLSESNFYMSNFENSDLSHSKLNNSKFIGCNFSRANLSFSNCENAVFDESNFIDRLSLVYALDIRKSGLKMSAKFRGARLRKASFRGADMGFSDFNGATWSEADFSGAKLNDIIKGEIESRSDIGEDRRD